jgi:hypothetical protein
VNWTLGLMRIAVLSMGTVWATAGETAGIRVVVIDYMRVQPGVLGNAKKTASEILGAAGIPIEWVACVASTEEPCPQMMPSDIHLRLQGREMAKQAGLKPACLGYAVSGGGLGSVAGVFLHQAIELQRVEGIPLHQILGAAIAHEIGHLLMAEHGHSRAGLMRAKWDTADMKRLAQGLLTFSEQQGQRMAASTRERLKERSRREMEKLASKRAVPVDLAAALRHQ